MALKTYPKFVRSTRYQYEKSGKTITLISRSAATLRWNNTFDGISNPNWRQAIKSGYGATTPATGSRQTLQLVTGTARADYLTEINANLGIYRSDSSYVTGALFLSLPALTTPASLSSSSADTQARLQFLSKYRQTRTTFEGGTFFGELAETVRMLRHPAQALRRGLDSYYSTVKKRVGGIEQAKRNAVRSNRIVQDTWLEYSYGWRPLINDIRDAGKLLNAHPWSHREVIQAQASSKLSDVRSRSSDSFGLVNYYVDFVTTGTTTVRYKGAVTGSVSPPTFQEQLGFAPSNFLPTIWNLIPYSFLVDYFTNIGQVIDGASLGIVGLAWGNKTVRRVRHRSIARMNASTTASLGASAYISASGGTVEWVTFERSPVTAISVSIADIAFRVPGIGSTKWLNIAALARLRTL